MKTFFSHFNVLFLIFLIGITSYLMKSESGCAAEETIQNATSTTPAPAAPNLTPVPIKRLQEGKPPDDTELIYTKTGAKVAFLVFLVLFIGLYFLIRRQPTLKEIKKKQKRRF